MLLGPYWPRLRDMIKVAAVTWQPGQPRLVSVSRRFLVVGAAATPLLTLLRLLAA